MADNKISYGDIIPRVGLLSVLRLLENALPRMVMQRLGQITTLPKKRGDTVKWRRAERFAAAMAPLAEGVPPTAQPLRMRDYVATLQQFGAVCKLTDKCVDLHEDNPLDVALRQCSDQFAETEERLTIELCKSSANRYFAGGVAGRTTVTNKVTRGDLRLVDRGFARANVQKLNRLIAPTTLANTWGIEESYFLVAHTDLAADFRNCTNWRPYSEYGDPDRKIEGEIGAVEDFRIVLSNLVEPYIQGGGNTVDMLSNGAAPGAGGAACDVYPILCLGKDAFGVVRLQGANAAHIMVLQPGVARYGDELGQNGSVGWKFWWGGAILFEDACAVLEVACTANPN
ncbi:MAG: N4-gp56 family major capsid protein [Kiritimatiellae bacterium]|nr:N4-gp56 family major capsid protein [Kiritimatiellia bacterium]